MPEELSTTFTSRLSEREADDYDRFVSEARGGHYSQARDWARVATAGRSLRPRWFVARERGAGRIVGCGMLLQPSVAGLRAPSAKMERGPVCDDPERVAEVSRALAHAARLRGIVRLAVMPYWADGDADLVERALAKVRFRSVQQPTGSHACTLRLAIGGKTDQDVFAGGERRSLRTELKQAERLGARARVGGASDLPTLARLHDALMGRQGMRGKPKAFYDALARHLGSGGRASVVLCEHAGDAVAAVLVVRHGLLTTFVMGATDTSKRPFTKMAPALSAAIRKARDEGSTTFDLGGVPMPGDDDEKRTSIARFKYDFARQPVRLVGEHARWF